MAGIWQGRGVLGRGWINQALGFWKQPGPGLEKTQWETGFDPERRQFEPSALQRWLSQVKHFTGIKVEILAVLGFLKTRLDSKTLLLIAIGNIDTEMGDFTTEDRLGLNAVYGQAGQISVCDQGGELYSLEMETPREEACELDWNLLKSSDPETRLSILTAWVIAADHKQLSYSLILPDAQIPAGSGSQHRSQCLELLALYQL